MRGRPPRGRALVAREREAEARGDFEAAPVREAEVRDDLAAPVEVELDLRVPAERLAPVEPVAPADLPRAAVDFLPVAEERDELEREELAPEELARADRAPVAVLDFARPPAERFADEPAALVFPVPAERPELVRDVEDADPLSVVLHLPDITRWAASATASAMMEPSLVALETTLLAAWDAVSAASSPASRIFLRAAGLALIAAAAAARPAASISLLIAAFASLSTVVSAEPARPDDEAERGPEELERDELLREDLAIASLPALRKRHFKAVPVP